MAKTSLTAGICLLLVLVLALTGVVPVQAASPSNDNFHSASDIIEPLPFSATVETSEATRATDDPDCYGSGKTVWYQFTPSQDMEIQANTFGSNYDTTLSVYTGTPGSLTQLLCADNTRYISQTSYVVLHVNANQTYYFMVGSAADTSGGTLHFQVGPFVPFTADLQIDGISSSDRNGNAILRGTLNCSRWAYDVSLYSTVEQKVGKRVIVGTFDSGDSYMECQGETPWEITVHAENGRFKAGPVHVTMYVLAFDALTNEGLEINTTAEVRLKKK